MHWRLRAQQQWRKTGASSSSLWLLLRWRRRREQQGQQAWRGLSCGPRQRRERHRRPCSSSQGCQRLCQQFRSIARRRPSLALPLQRWAGRAAQAPGQGLPPPPAAWAWRTRLLSCTACRRDPGSRPGWSSGGRRCQGRRGGGGSMMVSWQHASRPLRQRSTGRDGRQQQRRRRQQHARKARTVSRISQRRRPSSRLRRLQGQGAQRRSHQRRRRSPRGWEQPRCRTPTWAGRLFWRTCGQPAALLPARPALARRWAARRPQACALRRPPPQLRTRCRRRRQRGHLWRPRAAAVR